MGTHIHRQISVTSWHEDSILKAYEEAKRIGLRLSEISPSATNGFRTFVTWPCGSKVGWPEADEEQENLEVFAEWLKANSEGVWVSWVSVSYGEMGAQLLDGDYISDVECESSTVDEGISGVGDDACDEVR